MQAANETQIADYAATPMRWTVDSYHQLVESGILRGRRVELIQGDLIEMAPEGPQHSSKTASGGDYLRQKIQGMAILREAHPITLEASEPEPDIAVVRGRHEDYEAQHPYPEDVLLLVEIAQSTLAYDLNYKKQVYAKAGIREYWVLAVSSRKLHVFQNPKEGTYSQSKIVDSGVLTLLMLPSVSIDVKRLLR